MQTALILPELASGRGTTRRVVEGKTRLGLDNDPTEHRIRIAEDVGGLDPKRFDARRSKPFIPSLVALWPVATRMRFSVNFNRQPCIAAEEIENIWTGRMLTAELETLRSLTKALPQNDFG